MSSTAAEGYKKPPRKRPPKPRTEPLRRGDACSNCRHLKIRCDGARPVCGPCTRVPKDDECKYTDGSSRTKSLEATIARLKARVSELENADSPPPRSPSDPELGRLGVSPSLSPAISSNASETALPLPTDPVEEGERIRAFWMLVCHQTSLLMAIRTPGNTFSILEAPGLQIDTPWPLELGEYELGMMSVDLRSCDTIDEFMVHGISGSASPFALQAQATVLLQRAIQLARRWSPGMQPQAVSAHASSSAWLETHIQQLQTQVSLALLHASIIHLHKNNTGDTSTSLAAARGILAVFTDPEADASDDLSRAGPVVGTLILLACQLILREIKRTRYLRASMGTTLNADAAYKQEEASLLVDLQNGLTTMTLFALDSPLGQYQLSKVQHKCDSLGL
uniref:Zn(2)-C6 fungal-type domain-containing protein n=1 Tax=Mycena chlorophos TaxID=658473 RepID=A0ABQ0KXK5_MYCCL|nr:predicted protein [Mycena chlorophos]